MRLRRAGVERLLASLERITGKSFGELPRFNSILDSDIFRLSGGHNAFVTKPLEPASFAEDERILRNLQFTRRHDPHVLSCQP